MAVLRSGNRRAAWMTGALFLASMLPAAAFAYTAEQEQACTNDAFRLCSSEIPDVARITACMAQHKAELSPPCQAQFTSRPDPAAAAPESDGIKPVRVRKPASAKPASAKSASAKSARAKPVSAKPAKPRKSKKPAKADRN